MGCGINPLDFYKEQGYEVFQSSHGWATFEIIETTCYLQNVFVEEKSRRNGKASWMAERIEDIARQRGCDMITTTINTCGKIDVTRSLKTVLNYGFEYAGASDGYLLFKKEIK